MPISGRKNLNPEAFTILIVDDNPNNLGVLFELLDDFGFKVLVATEGESAIDQAEYAQPDLILLDVMMPGIDGFETCRLLKNRPPTQNIPVIFMTALSDTVDKVKGFELGAVDYITKPFHHEEMLARVVTHLTVQSLQQRLKTQNKQLKDLNKKLQTDLKIAHEIQQSLLPPPQPNWSHLDVICYNAPARSVGGDFYLYHHFSEHFSLIVGDVSGKGMPAALLMAISMALFPDIISSSCSPALLLEELDQAIRPYTLPTHQNCALVYTKIIPPTSSKEGWIEVANAGCIAPLVRRASGSTEWIDVGGLPLGVGDSIEKEYTGHKLPLSQGDFVILCSDGVVEATTSEGTIFSFERFEEAVRKGPAQGAEAMLTHLKNEIAAFTQGAETHDDLTLVILQL